MLLRELLLVLRPIPQFAEVEMLKKLEVDSRANPKPRLLLLPFCRNIPAADVLVELPQSTLTVTWCPLDKPEVKLFKIGEGEGGGREGKILISIETCVKQYFGTSKIQNFFQDDTASHKNAKLSTIKALTIWSYLNLYSR